MLKLKRQVMQALNIKVTDIPGQTEPVHDLYKNRLDDGLDSNINDIVASTIDTNPCPLRQTTSATQVRTFFDVSLPLGLFCEAASDGDKNSSFSKKRSLLPTLLPSIMPR